MSDTTYAFPASFAQQRLWFADRLVPGNPFYNLHTEIPIPSRVDRDAMARTLRTIVDRHETLRTSFDDEGGTPVQVVHPAVHLEVEFVDLHDLPAPARSAAVRTMSAEHAGRPFDLRRAPLLRTALLQLADDDFVLLITIHHIVSDGWSLGVLMREIQEIYGAYVQGRACPLEPLAIQYADFAIWQREWLQGAELETQLAYWRERLADLPALELPTDRRRPRLATFTGSSVLFRLPDGIREAATELGRTHGVTLFMFLLAGFTALLHRYTGQSDIVIGSPIANRTRAELEGLIGFFVNTLVLRTRLDGDPDVIELLARVKETTLGAYRHQDLPFDQLVEDLQPERDPSRNPLVQVVFQLHNAPTLAVADASAMAPDAQFSRGVSAFDLVVNVWQTQWGLAARIDYSTELFDAITIERLAAHYGNLLASAVADPRTPLSALTLLDADEWRRIVVDLQTPPAGYPRDACIHELFDQCAEQTPHACALASGNDTMTYSELRARAERVADGIASLPDGGPGIVAICIERSFDMVAGLLGILKAGCAYLALDEDMPANRLRLLARHAGLTHILCCERSVAALGESGCELVTLERLGARADGGTRRPRPHVTGENLAYVAYTSGSTGEPKGVCVPHRAVVRLVRQQTYVAFSPRHVFFQCSPLSFDASTFEIWGSLLNGARLAIQEPGVATLDELGRSIERHGVTTLWLTSALFNQMVDSQMSRLTGVRQLLAGGDVLSAAHVRRALEAPGERVVVNGYGPTEGTTFTACERMERPSDVRDPVSIGRPLAGTQVYVLDNTGNPAPIGVAGELYIGGDGVAVGYLNASALTADRFVRDRFSNSGTRLYRTGDRVRWRHDGTLEFVGRVDRQVKLRGFRVEPGEVEAVLSRQAAVADAAVLVSGDGERRRLVAYVVAAASTTAAELRAYVERELPAFMVPSAFVLLESLPITDNGKVDTRQLERLDPLAERAADDAFVEPRSGLEIAIAAVWCEVLQRERVHVHANFFTELGGHSLLATQVASRLRERFDVELPLRSFFESPTIAQLASRLEELLVADISAMSDDEVNALLEPSALPGGPHVD